MAHEALTTLAVEFIPIFYQLWVFGPCCWYIMPDFSWSMITHLDLCFKSLVSSSGPSLSEEDMPQDSTGVLNNRWRQNLVCIMFLLCPHCQTLCPFHVRPAFATHSAHNICSLRCNSQTHTISSSFLIFPEGRLVHTVDLRDHNGMMHDKYSWEPRGYWVVVGRVAYTGWICELSRKWFAS